MKKLLSFVVLMASTSVYAESLEAYAKACQRQAGNNIKRQVEYLLTDCRYRDAKKGTLMSSDTIALVLDKNRHDEMLQNARACLGDSAYLKAIATCSDNETTTERSAKISRSRSARGSVTEILEQKPQPPQRLTFHNIHFASGKADVTADSMRQLREVAAGFNSGARGMQNFTLLIEGHADSDPWVGMSKADSDAKNQWISAQRAEAVRGALLNLGLSSINITTIGYGSSRPLVAGEYEAAWAQNRRVEMQWQDNHAHVAD